MKNVKHPLSSKAVQKAVDFACEKLKIDNSPYWEIFKQDKKRNYWGRYFPDISSIAFNGRPTLDTIFHECVHHKQKERGVNLIFAYSQIKTHIEYWNLPYEIEARNEAAKLIKLYTRPSFWDSCFGLRSDHSYY